MINLKTPLSLKGISAALIATVGLAGAVAAQDVPTIYVIAPSLSDPFWVTQQNGAGEAGDNFNVRAIFQSPAQDTGDAGMVPLVQAAIAAHADGIAIDYTSKTMEAVTTAALDAGISVVLYNNNRFEGENAPSDSRILDLAFIGQDESMSGEVLATAWMPLIPAEACKILVVNPFPSAFVLTLRADGLKRVFDAKGYPYEDLVVTADQGQNLSLISAALQADPSICAVAALGGPAANPAARYISDNNLDIPVVTFDVGAETAHLIKEGSIGMALNQQPFLQSYFAVANLAHNIRYNLSPANVDTGTSIVTGDNIDIIQACLDAGRC